MVDPRDFLNAVLDQELAARADQLELVGGSRAREEKRGSMSRHQGYIWLGRAGHSPMFDVVVCDRDSWAMTLISDTAPPMGREVELEWESKGGVKKRIVGQVTEARRGIRVGDPLPDLFFSRFEASFL